jgi:hypothetical protein
LDLALNLFTRSFKPESLADQDAFLIGGGHSSAAPLWMKLSGVWDHARYLCVVAIGDKHHLAELAFHFWRFGRKDMARLGLVPLDFAGTGLTEALFRARMGFQLGHFLLVFWTGFGNPSPWLAEQGLPCP